MMTPSVKRMPGSKLEVNIGQIARQAKGSAWLSYGNNVILSTVSVAKKESDGGLPPFFPLMVECRERVAAVGKFPGGFMKREGKLTDSEVLLSRIVDRSIRPLFPAFFMEEVQVMVSLLSFDGEFPLEVLAVLSTSLSLMLSQIPFDAPIGAVLCAKEKGGTWKINPSASFVAGAADTALIVGSKSGICMVEANCDFASNEEMNFLVGEEVLAEMYRQIDWQESIAKELGLQPGHEHVAAKENFASLEASVYEKIKEVLPQDYKSNFFSESKGDVSDKISALKKFIIEKIKEANPDVFHKDILNHFVSEFLKRAVPNTVVEENKRFDLRTFEKIRNITSSVGLLPMAHGSSLFTRGETQALSTLVLGTGSDAQKVEPLLGETIDKAFMLHYNFPPYATGEVKPLRGVGRREIGHGCLAEKSFSTVIPSNKDFPYTIKSIVDILESNGSSSMATVCATTLSLMDAGVPIKKMISGIAMGLFKGDSKSVILSDITGMEDAYGYMDFKVVGDEHGITAIQIDVKGTDGLTPEIFRNVLVQAQEGRAHILSKMRECMTAPRATLKESAPRCFTMKVPTSKIGMIVGPGGKNIKQIVAETGTQIDIADDGTVSIFASSGFAAKKAEGWIRVLIGDVKNGCFYQGKVSRIVPDLGMFVALVPGKDGLIHISSIDKKKRDNLENLYKAGDPIDVVVVGMEGDSKIRIVAPELESNENN